MTYAEGFLYVSLAARLLARLVSEKSVFTLPCANQVQPGPA